VPKSKLFFSPYCIDASTFQADPVNRVPMRQATRERFGIREDAVVVLFSGKLSERKGVDLIPHAVRMLPQSLRERVHLLFLGDGALRDSVRMECEQEPQVAVTFAGFQNQSALSAFYHAADLLVLPSRAEETWGLVVNEAMLHGLPCIVSTTVGSQPDLVLPGETGEVCAPGDVDDLARAMAALMGRLQTPSLADICRARVAKYSVAQAAEGLASASQAVMKSA
jgi:glycosyltransferase involved in cell wall biosynthesis